jgi:hypothetical protein
MSRKQATLFSQEESSEGSVLHHEGEASFGLAK